jgi:hypothetical protein
LPALAKIINIMAKNNNRLVFLPQEELERAVKRINKSEKRVKHWFIS